MGFGGSEELCPTEGAGYLAPQDVPNTCDICVSGAEKAGRVP